MTVTRITRSLDEELIQLAENVDTLRAELDVSYRVLAARIGISHPNLYRQLAKRERPTLTALGRAMSALADIAEGHSDA